MDKNIKITHIVAHDLNRAIGKENALAWNIPKDLEHFSKTTQNGIIIMGRKTFDSIGRILPRRQHIIISRDKEEFSPPVYKVNSIEKAVELSKTLAKTNNIKEVFIIGGAEIYNQTMHLADKIISTEINLKIDGADAFYPSIPPHFKIESTTKEVDPTSKIEFQITIWSASQ